MMDQEPDIGPEPLPPPTREEQEAEAWEHWHQRAVRFEAALYQIHTVCADNAGPTCKHDMALNFVAQIAARAAEEMT
jgi:hypothetical protein